MIFNYFGTFDTFMPEGGVFFITLVSCCYRLVPIFFISTSQEVIFICLLAQQLQYELNGTSRILTIFREAGRYPQVESRSTSEGTLSQRGSYSTILSNYLTEYYSLWL